MTTVVIPFAGAEGKTRLHASRRIRRALAHAMFCDVLAACLQVGRTRVVTPDEEGAEAARDAGAEVVADPGGGQGPAVPGGFGGVGGGGVPPFHTPGPCASAAALRPPVSPPPPGMPSALAGLYAATDVLR